MENRNSSARKSRTNDLGAWGFYREDVEVLDFNKDNSDIWESADMSSSNMNSADMNSADMNSAGLNGNTHYRIVPDSKVAEIEIPGSDREDFAIPDPQPDSSENLAYRNEKKRFKSPFKKAKERPSKIAPENPSGQATGKPFKGSFKKASEKSSGETPEQSSEKALERPYRKSLGNIPAGLLLATGLLYAAISIYMVYLGYMGDYAVVLLPTAMLTLLIQGVSIWLKADGLFTFCMLMLLNIGTMIQVVIGQYSPTKYVMNEWIAFFAGGIGCGALLLVQRYLPALVRLLLMGILNIGLYVSLLLYGTSINGSTNWITIHGISIQLTELTRLLAICTMALAFANRRWKPETRWKVAFVTTAINVIFLLLIREMGTMVILACVFLFFSAVLTHDIRYFFKAASACFVGAGGLLGGCYLCKILQQFGIENQLVTIGVSLLGKIISRMTILLHPETLDPYNEGYQYYIAKKAIQLGGWFGTNYKMEIPVAYSDYVFVSLIFRMGYVMAIAVILLFLVWYVRGLLVMKKAGNQNPEIRYTNIGFMSMIMIQSAIAILGSTNAGLLMGLPVAFLSAGGTNQAVLFLMILYFSASNKVGHQGR